jgi:uncharacterized Zn finger protein (UPF0148 family)
MIRCGRCGALLDEPEGQSMRCPLCGALLDLEEDEDYGVAALRNDRASQARPAGSIEPRMAPARSAPLISPQRAEPGFDRAGDAIRCGRCGYPLNGGADGTLQCPACGAVLNFDEEAPYQDDHPYFVGDARVNHNDVTHPIEIPLIPTTEEMGRAGEAFGFGIEHSPGASPPDPSLMGVIAGVILLVVLLLIVAIASLLSITHH